MTTELLAAPPVSGKISACIQRIRLLRSRNPPAPIWVVVPDRLQAAAFRARLADQDGSLFYANWKITG